jgi:hypothetical protein
VKERHGYPVAPHFLGTRPAKPRPASRVTLGDPTHTD